ncbi:MAG: 2-C-methyl-D-erythritol 2,4-cyclodiphosphate synthase [Thermodesulfobacteriota bacterium]|nr:MAG: 2-C-methyl-D-erythritol 2,4-cyclodiphosphate synthase [Thermodesulfobacteriota bacterium]
MRIGFGYDVHRLAAGRRLILGGVQVDYEKGLEGHSDADVLLHAVIDALIGAAALGDIGKHFPPTDPAYKDISSIELLKHTAALLDKNGFYVVNVDSTVVCEAPRLRDHIADMTERIAAALATAPGNINVKATTEEGLGFTGSGSGIAAYAVALIEEKK